MIGLEAVTALVAKHGLAVVAPFAVLEGPVVTVIAAWLASLGLFPVWALALVVIAADLAGDLLFYGLGRWGRDYLPERYLDRVGLGAARLAALSGHFDTKGGRTLLFGKFTHSVGFAVLAAAGAGRMKLGQFLWFNLIGTVPKSLFFVALGYGFGTAYARIDNWISRVSLVLLVLILAGGVSWFLFRKVRR
ncbi:MAG: VTT domain-containing protein [Maritimibacter sp.]|nr:VTT domain-containing protein [Maritimibacter sp.]